MKRALFIALTFVATACGSANDASLTSDIKPIPQTDRVLFPIEGEISSVEAHSADAPAVGLWTEVNVEFLVDCSNRFESAALGYQIGNDGQVKILVSAFASAETAPQQFACQAFSHESAKITLPGIVSHDNIQLVHLKSKAAGIPNDTASITSVGSMKVVATRSLCPEGMACVYSGTIVTLETTLNSCVNSLGPVAYAAHQRLEKGEPVAVSLTVNAIEFHSEQAPNVRCFAPHVVTTEISLPMVFGTAETINLRVIQ